MAKYDEREYHPKLQVLREECEKTGHAWRFSNFGPLGHAWYMCTVCKKFKREEDDHEYEEDDDDTTN